METRKAWYEVYIGHGTFAEYATNNPSSAMMFIRALGTLSRLQRLGSGAMGVATVGRAHEPNR
jgi:hypothetical protein